MTSPELEATELEASDIALVELVDRLLAKGVVISGDVTIAVADIDLIQVGLRALVASVETLERAR